MKTKAFKLKIALLMGALVTGSCAVPSIHPDLSSTAIPPMEVESAPAELLAVRDATLSTLVSQYDGEAPSPDLPWEGGSLGPADPTISEIEGWRTYQFSARADGEDRVVLISYPTSGSESPTYRVRVTDEGTGFRWEGRFEDGHTCPSPEAVISARDSALVYLIRRFGDMIPKPGPDWMEELITPEGLPEWVEYRFTTVTEAGAREWVVTAGHAILPPDQIRYQIKVANPATGFRWEGDVDSVGQVHEPTAPTRDDSGPAFARDAAMAYLSRHVDLGAGAQLPSTEASWLVEILTPEEFADSLTLRYSAGDWAVTVGYSLLTPEATVYLVFVDHPVSGFHWEGQVDATGQVIEEPTGRGETAIEPTTRFEQREETPGIGGGEQPLEDIYTGSKTYFNERFGYTFRYPGFATVSGENLDQALQITGPTVEGGGWLMIGVSHMDTEFFHPPVDADLHAWLDRWGLLNGELQPPMEIAGLPAIHITDAGGAGGHGSDHYYFVNEGQLFYIQIVHAGEKEDRDLYDEFLTSFQFVEGQLP